MRRTGPVAVLTIAALAVVLVLPGAAFAVLQNEYGMKYAGQAICLSCHDPAYGETTHSRFAQVGADPSADYMYPAGRPGVGEMVNKDEIAFTLGAGTGLREYLVNNPAAAGEDDIVPITSEIVKGVAPDENRYGTAVEASKKAFDTADAVVVATGENYPDALGGSALAGAVGGPILLTKNAYVPQVVLDEIDRLGASTIYVLGSTSSISQAARDQLAELGDLVEISGDNRYETASLVASEVISLLGDGFDGKAFVATGGGFADALAASPVAYKMGMPILLASSSAVIVPEGVTDAVILGGTGSVSQDVEDQLDADLTGTVDRIAGDSRYDTAAQVADFGVGLGMSWDGFGLATGQNFPDALAAGPMCGEGNSVLLLTPSSILAPAAADAIAAAQPDVYKMYFFGGDSSITPAVRSAVDALLPDHVVNVPGDPNPFVVPALEWDPIAPDTWEMGPDGIEFETYTCNPCHHLGAVSQNKKPTVGNFVTGSVNGAANTWVTNPTGPTTSPEKYVEGASIQCEVCHGTGTPAGTPGNHFGQYTSNVKILKGTELLKSQVCGQCHGSYKSKSLFGYTPDQNMNLFVTYRGFNDVPTEASFTVNPGAYKFFPNGQNKGDKHSYYTEWTLSGHSYRGALTSSSPEAQMYQKAGNGHYSASTSSYDCAKCHTGEGYAKRKNLKIVQNITFTSANVGNLGQECATCHLPHGNASDGAIETESGMDVRKPDSGTTLAGITMTSICEDCHNWQLEMQNASIPTTFTSPKKDLTARGGFSHPTREVYNGRGMYEVPNADKFMPGVKCEGCHMPATKSDFPDKTGVERYANRSWKRYSHRMFIMEPGKAEDWGLAAWGDSCSPCHTGQTQGQLQGFIETWQDEAADAAAEASAAYATAFAGAPGSAEDTNTAQFKALMGRANYNYRNYLGEGSMGAHNPPYIVAGLEKAEQLAKSVNGEFVFVTSGAAFPGADYVMGTVANGDGSGAADAKVIVSVGATNYTVYADANGNFSLVYPSGTLNSATWKRCSDSAADIVWSAP